MKYRLNLNSIINNMLNIFADRNVTVFHFGTTIIGRMEDWNNGGLEGWKVGRLVRPGSIHNSVSVFNILSLK